jgi:hypothetical protein
VKVDASGELVLPSLIFTQVHRVRTHATVERPAGHVSAAGFVLLRVLRGGRTRDQPRG